MGASAFEYRHRYLLHTVLYVTGFVAPWNFLFHLDPPGASLHAWGVLAANLAQTGGISFRAAFQLLLVLAIVCAALGAFVRTWGSSYLGAGVVESATMQSGRKEASQGIVEAGPFRYVRNPLYLGTVLHTLALALVMPRSGAIFILIAIPLLQVRLILAEEPFLASQLGASYAAYCARVPRLMPSLRPRVPAQNLRSRWGQAIVSESYMWGVAISFAVAGGWYDSSLLLQCVVVSWGASMVLKAIVPYRVRG